MSIEEKSTARVEEPRLSFSDCVTQVEDLFGDDLVDMDRAAKHNACANIIRRYFADEDMLDVFEGFLRLLIEFCEFSTKSEERSDTALPIQVLQMFDEFINQQESINQIAILETLPQEKGIYINALKIVTRFRPKYLRMIACVFRLEEDDKKDKILISLVRGILKTNEIERAVEWIIYFHLRDYFPFDEIVCHLLLAGQHALLEAFIGEDIYRKKRLIAFLDKLIGMALKRFRGYTELEELLLQDTKKLEKNAVKYIKLYNVPDGLAPNVLDLRAREALLFHHHRWQKRETSMENYEQTALQAMKRSAYVRRYYLDYLCTRDMHRNALFFAVALGDSLESFPKLLQKFCENHPLELERTKNDVHTEKEKKEKLQEKEDMEICELTDGFPIHLVEDWATLKEVMEDMCGEPVIGIDTEWKPHFSSTKEQLALIQVASSKAVYLFDVVVLENRLSNSQWLEFFKALLCSDDTRKIGYDFGNDLRVMKSSFPFLATELPPVKHIICLYRLLLKVLLLPDVSKLIFESQNVMLNLNLYEVAKYFLGLELDKSERVGNWVQRPLRSEQKKYAALDAYALIGVFKVIAGRLSKLFLFFVTLLSYV